MKSFLNRKKAEPTPLVTKIPERNETPTLPSPGLKKSQSKWKKAKRQPESKPEFSLNNVLPSADDFRTSLIMPNLSARFSMLREQDDPNSLLGKASDDSVLQPRRRSRMIDFGYASRGNLGDIAEVSSVRSSIRPPFAENIRQQSFISENGYESDPNASIMSRARPGEGNVLFGGRQKVYMIPKSGSSSTTKLGKAVYEDDIKSSAFQKHKQREREAAAKMADEARQFDFGLDNGEMFPDDDTPTAQAYDQQDLAHSPSLSSYDKKRSTNSSSARSEARSSTAATSVASQPTATPAPLMGSMQSRPSLERSNTKARRLYEQGLDQHMYEQQTSALTRLNSIQRQRAPLGGGRSSPYLHQAKSTNNLHDPPGQRSVYAVRSQSPIGDRRPPPLKSIGSFKRQGSSPDSPVSGPASPLSPQIGDFGETDVLTQALEPGDRGKATAMGAFNKPKQAFDEKQYLERQMALQRSTSSAAMRREASAPAGFQQRIGRHQEVDHETRADSAASDRSRSRSGSKGQDDAKPNQGNRYSAAKHPNRSVTPSQLASFSPQINAQYPDTHRTFFGNIAASDSEDDEEDKARQDAQHEQHNPYAKWQPSVLHPVSEHPALRPQRSKVTLVEEEEEEMHPTIPVPPIPRIAELNTTQKSTFEDDSPTLGTRDDLNGMVSHLRSRSNASSMYPGDELPHAANVPDLPPNARHLQAYGTGNPHLKTSVDSDLRVDSTYSSSNPWELDDKANAYAYNDTVHRPVSPIEDSAPYGSRMPARSAAQRDYQGQSQVSGFSQDSDPASWQNELRKQTHNRDASNATQQERSAFDNELAARRAAIQENMKSIVEPDRSNSPYQGGTGNAFKALGILKTKSSRESMDPRRDTSKFNKMFGGNNSSTTSIPHSAHTERTGYSFEGTRPRGNSGSRPPMPQQRVLHSEQDARREWSDGQSRRSPASSNASQTGRSRSNSATTQGRSRSRTGPYRDDLEKAMVEGTGSSAAGVPDLTHLIPKELTPRPSPEVLQSNFDGPGGRARSGSRGAPPASYFEAKVYPPASTPRHPSNSSVPQILSASVYSPSVPSARSSPAPSPYLQQGVTSPYQSAAPSPFIQQTATPPLSGSSTPLNSGFGAAPTPPSQGSGRPLRKKTISKSDISEPTLISSTSTVDTVDLPPGASLKNGMIEPPPVPPINPKRKTRKLFGKGDRHESMEEGQVDRTARSKTPDPWSSFDGSNGLAPNPLIGQHQHHVLTPPLRSFESSPALNQYGFQGTGMGSPERHDRQAATGAQVNSGMF